MSDSAITPQEILDTYQRKTRHAFIPEVLKSHKTEALADLYEAMLGVIGEDSYIHDGAAGDEATWEGAQNQLRAEQRQALRELFGRDGK